MWVAVGGSPRGKSRNCLGRSAEAGDSAVANQSMAVQSAGSGIFAVPRAIVAVPVGWVVTNALIHAGAVSGVVILYQIVTLHEPGGTSTHHPMAQRATTDGDRLWINEAVNASTVGSDSPRVRKCTRSRLLCPSRPTALTVMVVYAAV